ncbi:hypothetical protein DFH07DRAFT_815878 [Mycena maculata]|uniref:Uncharacterized protein n=1 Tax=Mycena maculata TaxID=230809 RepID=A0AAD7JEH8_9AGAR|nr:hypothetical protein DFH07DRAFT_815878 [Mycena maculata]
MWFWRAHDAAAWRGPVLDAPQAYRHIYKKPKTVISLLIYKTSPLSPASPSANFVFSAQPTRCGAGTGQWNCDTETAVVNGTFLWEKGGTAHGCSTRAFKTRLPHSLQHILFQCGLCSAVSVRSSSSCNLQPCLYPPLSDWFADLAPSCSMTPVVSDSTVFGDYNSITASATSWVLTALLPHNAWSTAPLPSGMSGNAGLENIFSCTVNGLLYSQLVIGMDDDTSL